MVAYPHFIGCRNPQAAWIADLPLFGDAVVLVNGLKLGQDSTLKDSGISSAAKDTVNSNNDRSRITIASGAFLNLNDALLGWFI